MKPRSPLPDTLTELLEVAIADGRSLIGNENYRFFSGDWHRAIVDSETYTCKNYVCLAGAVMAGTLGTNHLYDCLPREFPKSVSRKLVCIDDMRTGDFRMAWMNMYGTLAPEYVQDFMSCVDSHFRDEASFIALLERMEKHTLPYLRKTEIRAGKL